jgi:hypothetical protein
MRFATETSLGHIYGEGGQQLFDFVGIMVDAQGIEPWTSPV